MLTAALLALATLPAPLDRDHRSLHPSDGPDADVRIRVDEDAVRFQIIVNLAFLDAVVDAPHEESDSIHPVEEPGIHDALFEFFEEELRVRIDGVEVAPIDRGFEVGEPDLELLPLFPLEGVRALLRMQIELEYPAKSFPETVDIHWGAYPVDTVMTAGLPEAYEGEVPTLPINANLRAAGIDTILQFTAKEPRYVWHDTGVRLADRFESVPPPPVGETIHVPLVSAAIAGAFVLFLAGSLVSGLLRRRPGLVAVAGLLAAGSAFGSRSLATLEVASPWAAEAAALTEAQALAVFAPLHANIYRAFDYADEGAVYDALARSVDGELLDELYNEIYRSLIQQEEGGAVSRVQAVRPLDTTIESIGRDEATGEPRFEVLARWQVDGTVFHWGHTHARTNEHVARYAVAAEPGGWRIASSTPLEQFRVESHTVQPSRPPRDDI